MLPVARKAVEGVEEHLDWLITLSLKTATNDFAGKQSVRSRCLLGTFKFQGMFLEQNAENSLLQSRSVAGAVNWIESSDKFMVVTRHAQDWRRQKVWMKKESWPIELRSSKNKEWREPALMAKKRMFVLRKKPSIYPSIHRRSFSASHLKRLALFWSCSGAVWNCLN